MRTYKSHDGRTWTVWEVKPDRGAQLLTPRMAGGWLCFESGEEKHRVAPIPRGWLRMDDEDLEALRRAGSPSDEGCAPHE